MGIFGKDVNSSRFQPFAYSFITVRPRELSVFLVKPGGCIKDTLLCLATFTIHVIMQRAALYFVLLLADGLLVCIFDSSSKATALAQLY